MLPIDSELFSRNFPIISEELQKRITKAKIGFLGCGLGSNIALLCARTGFVNFKLADGDSVEKTNLNRQSFFQEDIGKNKAFAIGDYIKRVNKFSNIQINTGYVKSGEEINNFLQGLDILVNTCDFSKGFYDVLRQAYQKEIIALAPFNVGFGSAVAVFGIANKQVILDLQKIKTDLNERNHFLNLLNKASDNNKIPKSFQRFFNLVFQNKKSALSYIPQVGIASNISASICVSLILRHLKNDNLEYFPRVYTMQND